METKKSSEHILGGRKYFRVTTSVRLILTNQTSSGTIIPYAHNGATRCNLPIPWGFSMQSSRSVFPKQSCHCLAPNGSSLCTRRVSYLISGHSLFVLCTYYTTFFALVKPFLNFYTFFLQSANEQINFIVNIFHRKGNIFFFTNKKTSYVRKFLKGSGETFFKKFPHKNLYFISSNLLQE